MKALLLNLLTMIQRNQMKNYYLYVPIIKASKAFSISSEQNCTRETFRRADEMTTEKTIVILYSKIVQN